MKHFTILVIVCVFHSTFAVYDTSTFSAEILSLMKGLHDNCVADSGASEDSINLIKKGEFPEDNNLKCYTKCLFSSFGLLDDNGAIDWDAYVDLTLDSLKKTANMVKEKCSSIKNTDHCQMTYDIYKCYFATDPDNFLIF